MEKTFIDAKDKNVAAVTLYAGDNGGFFEDEDYTIPVSKDIVEDLFYKNLLLVGVGDKESGGIAVITYIKKPVGITPMGANVEGIQVITLEGLITLPFEAE